MPVRITTTIDGKVTVTTGDQLPETVDTIATWQYDLACYLNTQADQIHVLVETWIDSDTEEQESSECGWK